MGKATNSLQYQLAKKFVISKVKQAMGFDRCLTFSSGAAPMSLDTKKYFMSLDMPIIGNKKAFLFDICFLTFDMLKIRYFRHV